MQPSFKVNFENGWVAQSIEVERQSDLSAALDKLGLRETRPVLVVIGGASKLDEEDFGRLQLLFEDVLAPLANDLGCFGADGGTTEKVIQSETSSWVEEMREALSELYKDNEKSESQSSTRNIGN